MNDFREIDDSSKEKDNMDKKSNNTDEYEKYVIYVEEQRAGQGKMISMPNNIYICSDCMQKRWIQSIIVVLTMMI